MPDPDSPAEELHVGDVVRCFALPSRRKMFRHATVMQLKADRVRVRYDVYRERWVPASSCVVIHQLRFRWKHMQKVQVES